MRKLYAREVTETHVPGGADGVSWVLDNSRTSERVIVLYGVGVNSMHVMRWQRCYGDRYEQEQSSAEPSFHRLLYRQVNHHGNLETTYIACDVIELSDVDELLYWQLEEAYGVRALK